MDDEKKVWVLPIALNWALNQLLSLYESFYSKSSEAKLKSPLLIMGPPGVGKTLFSMVFAQKFMKDNNISESRMKRINIAAIPAGLIESYLFGHEKGAFTGAIGPRKGLVEQLERGVLIMDEIGELSDEIQAKLLTFIEEDIFYRVGGDKEQKSKGLQIIATTNKTFEDECFRQDFFDRFFPFYILPLHKRRIDILYHWAYLFPELTRIFTAREILALLAYHWPGNVREIEKVGKLITWVRAYENKGKIREPLHKKQPLDNIKPGYSEISMWKVKDLLEELKGEGIDYKSIDSFLNEYNVGISDHGKIRHPLADVKIQTKTPHIESSNEFIIERLKFIDELELAYDGLLMYCSLFRKNRSACTNLLDLNDGEFVLLGDVKSPSLSEGEFQKYNRLLAMLSPFIDAKISSAVSKKAKSKEELKDSEEQVDIFSMTDREMHIYYYRGLIDRSGGNKKKAAKRAGLPPQTFYSRLKQYDI